MRMAPTFTVGTAASARAAYHCNNFVTEFVADEARFTAFTSSPGMTRRNAGSDYPTIVELADDLTEDDPDALFQFGIDLLLRGIEGLSTPGRSPTRRRSP